MYNQVLDLIKTENLINEMEDFELNNLQLIDSIDLHNYFVNIYEILEDELLYSYLGNRIYTDEEKVFLLGQIIQLKSYILNSKKNVNSMMEVFNTSYLKVCTELANHDIQNKKIQKELADLGKYLGTSDSGKEIFSCIKNRLHQRIYPLR